MGRIVIIGGGPAGTRRRWSPRSSDAEVTVVEAEGAGGACVLPDCVPSKTFIASSEVVTGYRHNEQFGIRSPGLDGGHGRRGGRATTGSSGSPLAQSGDIHAKLIKAGRRRSSPAGRGWARTRSVTPTRC